MSVQELKNQISLEIKKLNFFLQNPNLTEEDFNQILEKLKGLNSVLKGQI